VTIGLSYGDFIFHAILAILHAVKIVVSFTRYSTNIKNEVWWAVYMCLFRIPWVCFCQELAKLDDICEKLYLADLRLDSTQYQTGT